MTAAVQVTGASDSGKTTFIEQVVPKLIARGLRVGTVKHASCGFDADKPGSDSARHTAAGASPVLLSGPESQVLFSDTTESIPVAIGRHFGEVDLVLVEGFGDRPGPKILVHRKAIRPKERPPQSEVLFVITDEPLGQPLELAAPEIDRAADLLLAHVARVLDERSQVSPHVVLRVDGAEVALGDFVERLLAGLVRGTVTGLHGVPEDAAEIELLVKLGTSCVLPQSL